LDQGSFAQLARRYAPPAPHGVFLQRRTAFFIGEPQRSQKAVKRRGLALTPLRASVSFGTAATSL